jgi:septal ring factor EnvC (AmiA/AmiB activator)
MHFLPLFAETSPTWTDKEVLIAIGSTAGTLVSIAMFAVRLITAHSRRKVRLLAKDNADLKKENADLKSQPKTAVDSNELDQLTTLLGKTQQDMQMLDGQLKALDGELAEVKDREQTLRQSAEKVTRDLEVINDELKSARNRGAVHGLQSFAWGPNSPRRSSLAVQGFGGEWVQYMVCD